MSLAWINVFLDYDNEENMITFRNRNKFNSLGVDITLI